MKYTREFINEVKDWYFKNGEKVNETARHFGVKPQNVCRWRDIEKAREQDRLKEKSVKRQAYLQANRDKRNAYSKAYRQTEAGKEAEKRSASKKKAKVKSSNLTIRDCKLEYVDEIVSDNAIKFDDLIWSFGLQGYLSNSKGYYHRYIYEKYISKIPEGWQVHHIDCDRLNNLLSNLVCVPTEVHNYLHYLLRNNNVEEYNCLISKYKYFQEKRCNYED